MADTSLTQILKHNVQAWNQLRQASSDTRPDLTGADLSNTNLRGAVLSGANLAGAHLAGADLRAAKLAQATLTEARLSLADLVGADLRSADLQRADLRRANLCRAVLSDANLTQAILGATLLADTQLHGAIGLESCIHQGPSVVNQGTLARFRGLPVQFLRGCGFQDWAIQEARLLNPANSPRQVSEIVNKVHELRAAAPILATNLFISYSHEDHRFVAHLEKHLMDHGMRYWRDVHDAPAGPLDKIVVNAMRQNPTVLLVLSHHSVNSDWVEFEASKARELEKELERHVLCPISLDDAWKTCRWSAVLRNQIEKYHILPFHSWQDPADFNDKWARLLKGLNVFYGKQG